MRSNSIARKPYFYSPRRLKSTVVVALLFFYFAFHLVTGERGLLAYVRLKSEMDTKSAQYELIKKQKLDLATRVGGMRDNSLDLDLLEETARRDLGYSKKDEVINFD